MKHSAKAAARLAREREKQARRNAAATAANGTAAAAAAGTAAADAVGPARTVTATAVTATAVSARATAAARAATASTSANSATAVAGRPRTAGPRLAQLPYALVLGGLVAGLALMQGGSQAVKSGTLVIAGAVLAGSLARLILPDGKAGLLRSRRRLVDVALLTVLGTGLLIAGLIVQVPG